MLLHTRKHYDSIYRYSDIYIHMYIDFPISWLHLFITQVDKSTLTVDYKCIQMDNVSVPVNIFVFRHFDLIKK